MVQSGEAFRNKEKTEFIKLDIFPKFLINLSYYLGKGNKFSDFFRH